MRAFGFLLLVCLLTTAVHKSEAISRKHMKKNTASAIKDDLIEIRGKLDTILSDDAVKKDVEAFKTKVGSTKVPATLLKDALHIEKPRVPVWTSEDSQYYAAVTNVSKKFPFDAEKWTAVFSAATELHKELLAGAFKGEKFTVSAGISEKGWALQTTDYGIFVTVYKSYPADKIRTILKSKTVGSFPVVVNKRCIQHAYMTHEPGDTIGPCAWPYVGTLGGFFVDGGNHYAVTNKHVTERFEGAADIAGPAGNGAYICWNHVFPFGPTIAQYDRSDSALVRVNYGQVDCRIPVSPNNGGAVALQNVPLVANVGDQVWKYGRTTGLTSGVVSRVVVGVRKIAVTTVAPVGRWYNRNINRQFVRGGDSGSFVIMSNATGNYVVAQVSYAENDAERWYDLIPGFGPSNAAVDNEEILCYDIAEVLADHTAHTPGLTIC